MTTFISKPERRQQAPQSKTVYVPTMAPDGRPLGATLEPREVFKRHQGSDFANHVKNGAWKGRRCFIVGGGPSLKSFDWELLDGELVIAVNRAFEFCNPAITFSMDNRYYTWNQMGRANSTKKYTPEVPERFWRQKAMRVWVQIDRRPFPDGIYTLLNAGQKGLTRLMSDGVATGENSGYGALNLALNLGASPIYLLGYDMKGDGKGKQNWFHTGYMEKQNEHIYANKFMPYFVDNAGEMKNRGHEVINLSSGSALECFEKQEYPEASKVPVVVSFYTEGTPYEREADFLMRSCVAHGMPYEIRPLKQKGSWEQNCSMKPGFILDMMGKHPDRSIIWLDADATIEKRPTIFEKLGPGTDFACCHTSFIKEVGAQLATGVLYFAPTPKAKDLVVRWNYKCKRNPDVWDQAHLQEVVIGWDGKMVKLPKAYCHIVGKMADPVGGVVIMQHQASRRFRDSMKVKAAPPEIKPSCVKNGDSVASVERAKYADLWANKNYQPSQTQNRILQALMQGGYAEGKVLEFGCGNGAAVEALVSNRVDAQGMDITLAAIPEERQAEYREASLWKLPYEDYQFDMTYSTDVLEHLPPEKVDDAIREILRVTRRITVHVIATFSCTMHGQELHLTRQPIEWWQERFSTLAEEVKARGQILVVDRKDFMIKGLT